MVWKNRLLAIGLVSSLLPMQAALAADHLDGSATGVKADASTDINDVYAWISTDGTKVNLIMTVSPAANAATAKFSNSAYYVFHTASRSSFLSQQFSPTNIICSFDATQKISCWVGTGNTNFIYGDASATSGLVSPNGKIKIFAGPRKDHFFFNLDGFNAARTLVKNRQATTPITLDGNGCAAMSGANSAGLNTTEQMAVVNALQRAPGGAAGTAVDFFRSLNTLAIVMEVDKQLLTNGGAFISVWAGTHKK